jgi:arginyl-tRNA synthetase
MDFKTIIAENIAKEVNLNINEISDFVEVPKEKSNGDFSFPCFKLAKELKKAPQMIAEELKTKLEAIAEFMDLFEKIDVVNGFLNFYVSKVHLVKEATEKLNIPVGNISKCCQGKIGRTGIYKWSYLVDKKV